MDPQAKPPAPPRDAAFAYYPVAVSPRDDGISLVDLWLVLARRKAVFFVVAGLVLAVGLAYALLAPPKYRYWALIEIGRTPTEDGIEAVESASTILAKIDQAFLPVALADYLKTQPEGTSPPVIRASNPKGSETLMLEAEGPADQGPTIMGIQQAVIDRLRQDHADFVQTERQSIRADITATRNQLETLNTKDLALKTQEKRMGELDATLRERRGEIQRDLDAAIALKQTLLGADAAEPDINALLQVNVESRALHDQLMALDERLAVDLPTQIAEIRSAIDDNARDVLAQQEGIAQLESRLSLIRETRATQPPTRALEKSGPAKRMIVLLAGMLGLFLGMLSVFGVELVGRARAELAETGPGAGPEGRLDPPET